MCRLSGCFLFLFLQKIHNVDVFINALKARGVLVGGVKGKICGSYQQGIALIYVWSAMRYSVWRSPNSPYSLVYVRCAHASAERDLRAVKGGKGSSYIPFARVSPSSLGTRAPRAAHQLSCANISVFTLSVRCGYWRAPCCWWTQRENTRFTLADYFSFSGKICTMQTF